MFNFVTKPMEMLVFVFYGVLCILTGCATLGFPGYDRLGSFSITNYSGEVSLRLRHQYHGIGLNSLHEIPDSIRDSNASMTVSNIGVNPISIWLSLHEDKRSTGKAVILYPGDSQLVYYGPLKLCNISFPKAVNIKNVKIIAKITLEKPVLQPIRVFVGGDRGG